MKVLIALVVALAIGAAIAASHNATLLRFTDAIIPIGTLWINAIRMTVIPLVFALLITGVASASDLSAIGRIGARTAVVFFALLVGVAIVSLLVFPFVFGLLPHNAGGRPPLPAGATEAVQQIAATGTPTFSEWLVTLAPPNPVAAAANGAIVPFIIFTVLLALAIAHSPAPARDRLVEFFAAFRDAMLTLVRWVIAAAPIGVFALLLPLAAKSGAALVSGVGFYILVYSLGQLGASLVLYPIVALFARVPIRRFAQAVLPAQLIAFSSSSSIASLPALVEGAERGLGISDRVAGFVVPIAVSMFKIAAPLSWTIGALFIAWFYGLTLHAQQLALIAFAGVFLTFAAPGVPRGAFLLLTPLFLAVGLPAEGIGILIAVDTIPDLFSTVFNVTGNLAAAVLVAARSGLQPEIAEAGMVVGPPA
jgi:proton glutamate symport protein